MRSDCSVAVLHDLLQIAFDWSDFHLHRFVIRGKEYGVSRMGCTTFTTDAKKVLLSQFRFRVKNGFFTSMISAICGNIRSASKASSPSAKRRSTRCALVGLVHHRPKIAVGRRPTLL